jgi:NADH-quinone oxidoreductase subunit M
VITAGYLLWMLKRVFAGPLMERWAGLSDASPREVFAAGTLVFFILLIGSFPNVVVDMISVSVEPVAGLLRGTVG